MTKFIVLMLIFDRYDTLSRQYTEQKEKLLNQVVSGLVEVFNFQEHVTSTLEELKKEGEEEAAVAEALAVEMMQQQWPVL